MRSVFLANVNNVDMPIIENILVKNKINFFIKDLHLIEQTKYFSETCLCKIRPQ